MSGISNSEESITYVQVANAHCYEDVMGPVFSNLLAAQQSCVADPRCGAVYDEGCQPLEYQVRVLSEFNIQRIKENLEKVEVPGPTQYDPVTVYYRV